MFSPEELYTSVIPNLLVKDVAEPIGSSRAAKVDVCKFSGLVLAEANAYLTKPADPALLVDTVEGLLRQARREQ